MPETRVKIYRTPAEYQRDRHEAEAHGWSEVRREQSSDTLSVTYENTGRSEWAAAASGQPASPATSSARLVNLVTAGGGAMVVAGSFLPWITASSGFGSVARGGLEGGDGWIAAVAGGILFLLGAGALAGVRVNSAGWLLGMLAALTAGAIGFMDLQEVNERIASVDSDTVVAQVGVGLWLILAGSVVGGIAAISGLLARR